MYKKQKAIRTVIADQCEVTRVGIRAMLERGDDIRVVGEARNAMELQQQLFDHQPDILLLDFLIPNLLPGQFEAWAKKNCSDTPVLILTSQDRDCFLSKAIDGGAAGLVTREEDFENIKQAIYHAVQGKTVFTEEQFKRATSWRLNVEKKIDCLTRRQVDVLYQLAQGSTNQEISNMLKISVKTVEVYISQVLNLLEMSTRGKIIAWVYKHLQDIETIKSRT